MAAQNESADDLLNAHRNFIAQLPPQVPRVEKEMRWRLVLFTRHRETVITDRSLVYMSWRHLANLFSVPVVETLRRQVIAKLERIGQWPINRVPLLECLEETFEKTKEPQEWA